MIKQNRTAFTLIELPKVMSKGFTLVELLVVVTIIVVLLALLVPAMDRAIYQAELAVCATRMKAIASGAAIYAVGFNRAYPDRPIVRGGWLTTDLRYQNNGDFDDRTVLRDHIPLNMMVDPLVQKVDLTLASDRVQNSFTSLWFGTRYPGHQAMRKIGDRFSWTVTTGTGPRLYSFSLLAGDSDYFTDQNAGTSYTSHLDDRGTMFNSHSERPDFIHSYWALSNGVLRGAVDFNYSFEDGSVVRLDGVKTNKTASEADDRVVPVPILYSAVSAALWYQQVPTP